MRYISNLFIPVILLLLFLSGCGGGGSTSGVANNPAATTTISGVGAKGLIKGGTVSLYSLPVSGDITQKKLIIPAFTTDLTNATFSKNIGTFSGTILMEITGSYIDEADGVLKPLTIPLRAATVIGTGGGVVPVSITPLTEIAVRSALTVGGAVGSKLSPDAVTAANALVSDQFPFDILSDQPVEPLNTVMNSVTTTRRDYTLALAAIAKLNATKSLDLIIEGYRSEVASDHRLSPNTASDFKTALGEYLASEQNKSGTVSIPDGLDKVGYITTTLKLNASGLFATGTLIRGIQLTINLPTGISVKVDSSQTPLAGIITASGLATGSYLEPALYDSVANTLNMALINSNGFGSGEFASIKLQTAPESAPTPGNFTFSNIKVVTQGGQDITEITSIEPKLPL